MTPYYQRTERILKIALGIWLVGLCVVIALLAYAIGAFAEPRPVVVMPPSGQPIYVHPPAAPTAPTVILPPAGLPIYVHPSPSAYGSATVIVPGEMPIFVYPGGGQ